MIRQLNMSDIAPAYELMSRFFQSPDVLKRVIKVDPMKVATYVVRYLSNLNDAVAFGYFDQDGNLIGVVAGDIYEMAVSDLLFAEDRVLYAPAFAAELLSAFETWAKEKGCSLVLINALGSRNNEVMVRWLRMHGYTEDSFKCGKAL